MPTCIDCLDEIAPRHGNRGRHPLRCPKCKRANQARINRDWWQRHPTYARDRRAALKESEKCGVDAHPAATASEARP